MDEIKDKIAKLETAMASPDFWSDKDLAQEKIRELNNLKEELAGVGKYDKGDAVITIFAGAGGDDAEDFARMLFEIHCGAVLRRDDDPEQPRVALAPREDRLLHVADVEEAPLPRGILHRLVDQVAQHAPLAEARVLEFVEQPVVELRVEAKIDGQPRIGRL